MVVKHTGTGCPVIPTQRVVFRTIDKNNVVRPDWHKARFASDVNWGSHHSNQQPLAIGRVHEYQVVL